MEIIKKGFSSTDVDTYQVIEGDEVIFEGSQSDCLDYIFAFI